MKKKPYTSKKADADFSEIMRKKHPRCANCGKTINLGVSHYWGRDRSSTRYNEDNCIVLCWLPCHKKWEHEKQGDYKKYMLKKLGQFRYDELERLAYTPMKREIAIREFRERYLT